MNSTTDEARKKSRGQVGLRQGDIVNLISNIAPESGENTTEPLLVIVASHDCDIAAGASVDEFVEFFRLRKVKKLDSMRIHGRNARSLQFEAKALTVGEAAFFEINASSRFAVKKVDLWDRKFERQYSIDSDNQLEEFIDWLASRYRRAALPEKFEERYRRVRDEFWYWFPDLIGPFLRCFSSSTMVKKKETAAIKRPI